MIVFFIRMNNDKIMVATQSFLNTIGHAYMLAPARPYQLICQCIVREKFIHVNHCNRG